MDNLYLNDAVLIVAHPDDEILWFSSVLESVKQTVICYIDVPGMPDWTEGRKKSLKAYPLSNIKTLDVVESEVFDLMNWENPAYDRFGLKLHVGGDRRRRYQKNYQILKERLSAVVRDYRTVISHNPWGEYGNEEHVQIHLVLKDIQKNMDFEFYCPNYVSNKSWELMQAHRPGIDTRFIELPTNPDLAEDISAVYIRNGCWTWYDEWQWRAYEGFFKPSENFAGDKDDIGYVHPYNTIRVKTAKMGKGDRGRKNPIQKIKYRIGKIKEALQGRG